MFKSLDIFGMTKGMTYNGDDVYKTKAGSCFTLVFIIIMGIVAVTSYISWINGEPNISQGFNKEPKDQANLELSTNDLVLAVEVWDDKLKRGLETSELKGLLTLEWIYTKNGVEEIHTNFIDCRQFQNLTTVKIEDNLGILYDKAPFSCVPVNKSFILRGQQNTNDHKFFSIDIFPCTENCNAGHLDRIKTIQVYIYFVEAYLDLKNRENPLFYRFKSDMSIDLELKKKKVRQILIEKLTLEDDQGTIIAKKKTYKKFRVFNSQFSMSPNDANSISFGVFELHYANRNIQITRNYERFQDILGKLGGFSSIVMMIVGALYCFIREINMNLYIFNRTIFHSINVKEGKKVEFWQGFSFYIWKYCSCCKKKYSEKNEKLAKMYFDGQERYGEKMDIVKMSRNYTELMVMKNILFNKHQRALIENTFTYNSLKNFDDEFDEDKLGMEKLRGMFKDTQKYLQEEKEEEPVEKKINEYFTQILNENKEMILLDDDKNDSDEGEKSMILPQKKSSKFFPKKCR